MTGSIDDRPRTRGYLRYLTAAFAAMLLAAGLSATALETDTQPASAATVGYSQCNAHAAAPLGQATAVTCSVSIVNTIDANGGTSSVVSSRVCTLDLCTGDVASPSNTINAVHQCNGSNNAGGSTTICSVDIVNNISANAPGAPTAITLNQCVGSGGGGGTLTTGCIPSTITGATVTQCNGSVDGGGGSITCSATGTSSAAFPVTVDQCNGSERGGGSFLTCTTSITNNVIDTSAGGTSGGGTPTGSTAGGGAPTATDLATLFGTPGTGTGTELDLTEVTPPIEVPIPFTG